MPYADLQKRRDNVRRWKKANPDKVKAQKQRYRARRVQSPQPSLSPAPQPQRRYNLRHRKVKRPEKIQLLNLVVVLKDYKKKKDTLSCRREKNRLYYQQNRDRILAQRKEYRQKNLESFRAKETKRQREYRERNRDHILAKRKENRQRDR